MAPTTCPTTDLAPLAPTVWHVTGYDRRGTPVALDLVATSAGRAWATAATADLVDVQAPAMVTPLDRDLPPVVVTATGGWSRMAANGWRVTT